MYLDGLVQGMILKLPAVICILTVFHFCCFPTRQEPASFPLNHTALKNKLLWKGKMVQMTLNEPWVEFGRWCRRKAGVLKIPAEPLLHHIAINLCIIFPLGFLSLWKYASLWFYLCLITHERTSKRIRAPDSSCTMSAMWSQEEKCNFSPFSSRQPHNQILHNLLWFNDLLSS